MGDYNREKSFASRMGWRYLRFRGFNSTPYRMMGLFSSQLSMTLVDLTTRDGQAELIGQSSRK